jgi:hypothetical protein
VSQASIGRIVDYLAFTSDIFGAAEPRTRFSDFLARKKRCPCRVGGIFDFGKLLRFDPNAAMRANCELRPDPNTYAGASAPRLGS